MDKTEAISILRDAQKILEQNAHLVKRGEPRDAILTAIHMVSEVKHWIITNELLEDGLDYHPALLAKKHSQ